MRDRDFDVIVIGAGHAGCEAAFAAARLGCRVGVVMLETGPVAHMPCNPAIGGTAKGHLVREIDALGGLMGRAIDATGIQFRLLNRSRGPAVWSPRAQADKKAYAGWMKAALEAEANLSWIIGAAGTLLLDGRRVTGVALEDGERVRAQAVVVTAGTFLNGLIHVGPEQVPAGRAGERPSRALAESLKACGFKWGRLKTGTPPRLLRDSIDFGYATESGQFREEHGDQEPVPLSFQTDTIEIDQIPCYQLFTNEDTHQIVRDHVAESPLFNGQIRGIGPRYCPSLEDKVMRFASRDRHHLYLEPEGRDASEIYVNGLSMSLPREIQDRIVRSLPGLQDAQILRYAYAVEYDFIQPIELRRSLETRRIAGLYLAGQVNGTSGYEEAAAQGLMAGINAARAVFGGDPVVLGRDQAYIGVLIDDLTTTGCLEPYRMFTSRAEHRLLLRIDNADLRLTPIGRAVGLVDDSRWGRFEARQARYDRNLQRLRSTALAQAGGGHRTIAQILRRPQFGLGAMVGAGLVSLDLDPAQSALDLWSVETAVKYEGYLVRQAVRVERARRSESRAIPDSIEYAEIPGLSRESIQRLGHARPETLGQASRVPGVTPAAVAAIGGFLDRRTGSSSVDLHFARVPAAAEETTAPGRTGDRLRNDRGVGALLPPPVALEREDQPDRVAPPDRFGIDPRPAHRRTPARGARPALP
jgi:tRNA uridine 5-carboxymethylaminomethyl modification enzyme